MNVLYFIYSHGQASGGHYHSLNQISKEFGKTNNVRIITLGPNTSPVISSNPFFYKHVFIRDKFKSLYFLNRELKRIINDFSPNILHCFDAESLNYLLILPSTFKYTIVLNKCGGPNPRQSNYQHANGLVVFSNEDYKWFKNNINYKNEPIHLIPNRVEKLQFLTESDRKEEKDPEKITFVRITRLGGAYEKTLCDSFNMIQELAEEFPVQLIVIGRIQDKSRYQFFIRDAKKRNLPVRFITDEKASKGSDFLYLADYAIGTGRSFMEALSLGIPTLTPAQNTDWPVLVNEENFTTFFDTNFSERNIADEKTIKFYKNEIRNIIKDKKSYKLAQKSAKFLFQEHLSTNLILSKYMNFYRQVCLKPSNRLSLIFKNFPYLLKFYLVD